MATDAKTISLDKAREDDAKFYWLADGYAPGGFVKEIDHSANVQGTHALFNGIKIVDCDTHFTEPPDLFKNVPEKFKGRAPRVERIDGLDRWMIGDKDFGSLGGNVIAKDRNKLLGRLSYRTYDEIHPGSYSVKPRLEEMDKTGIWAQICFQNGGLTQAGSLLGLGDIDLAMYVIQRFNDACAERLEESNGRIACMATLPYWDKDLMVGELKRVLDMGVKGFTLPDRPERLNRAISAPITSARRSGRKCSISAIPPARRSTSTSTLRSMPARRSGTMSSSASGCRSTRCCTRSAPAPRCPTSWSRAFSTSTRTSRSA